MERETRNGKGAMAHGWHWRDSFVPQEDSVTVRRRWGKSEGEKAAGRHTSHGQRHGCSLRPERGGMQSQHSF